MRESIPSTVMDHVRPNLAPFHSESSTAQNEYLLQQAAVLCEMYHPGEVVLTSTGELFGRPLDGYPNNRLSPEEFTLAHTAPKDAEKLNVHELIMEYYPSLETTESPGWSPCGVAYAFRDSQPLTTHQIRRRVQRLHEPEWGSENPFIMTFYEPVHGQFNRWRPVSRIDELMGIHFAESVS